MIKRIKKIKGVGRFLDVGHMELGHVTLIYGPNCYGKSTLAEIFRSIGNNDPVVLLNRQSIVKNGRKINQEICLSVKNETEQKEHEISFSNQKWEIYNFNYSIEVFDSRFIENNVFTGLTISRSNKENLTNLLIGEKSVEIGKKIDFLKKSCREITKTIGELENLLKVKLGTLDLQINLEDFISVEKTDDIEKTKYELIMLQQNLEKLRKSINEKNKILELDKPIILSTEYPDPIIKNLEDYLEKGFEDINDSAYKKIQKHIEKHFNSRDGAEEEWLERGVNIYLKQKKDITSLNCPFCSQSLSTVTDLIETYRKVFSKEYEKFCKEIIEILDREYRNLSKFIDDIKLINVLINKNLVICQKWQDYFVNKEQELIEQLYNLSDKIDRLYPIFVQIIEKFADEIKELIHKKKSKPFVSIKEFPNVDRLLTDHRQLTEMVNEYNMVVSQLLIRIDNIKTNSQNSQLIEELRKLKYRIRDLNIKIKRYELSTDIDKLQLLKLKKKNIEQKIKNLQEKLEQENKEFFEEYFQEVTNIFNKLGSDDFEIQVIYRRWGDQPVYEPTIKFANEEITSDQLPFIFSDADRRSLAFSIFISKLKKKSEHELKNTIVFLDDPITSFDDNRISQTFIEIKNLATSCRQLIIVAHHSRFLLDTYKKLKNIKDLDLKFIEIKRVNFGSEFELVIDPEVRLDPYAQEIEKVERFIDGDSTINAADVRRLLRLIMEEELKLRFRPYLKKENFNGVGEIGDILKNKGVINEEILRKIYDFNDVLKGNHHEIDLNTDEDTRSLAKSLIEFIFKDLNPCK